jgi:hypothetical protein
MTKFNQAKNVKSIPTDGRTDVTMGDQKSSLELSSSGELKVLGRIRNS